MKAVSVNFTKVTGMFVPTNTNVYDKTVFERTTTDDVSHRKFRLTQSQTPQRNRK